MYISTCKTHNFLLQQEIGGGIDVRCVDGFQGREADFIVLSCVRSSGPGFTREPNRVNVAVSRAKLVVCYDEGLSAFH